MFPSNDTYSDFFTVHKQGHTAVVSFEVRTILDTVTIAHVANDLYELVDRHGLTNLVLDMGGVRFLSSQAMGTLVNLLRKTRMLGGGLVLVGVGEDVGRIFRVTRLDQLFTFADTIADGMATLPHAQVAQPAPQ